MSSLSSLRRDMIRFLWAVDTFVISWRICSIDFFCIFFIFFLSAIFIMISHLLRSDDNLSLRRYFLIVTSSLVTFTHDVILNEKHMLSCICMLSCVCSCLLSSCTNDFSFCTFFAMNAFWFSLFFSFESFQRRCISFTATSFHEWSLLFSFSNVDVCIRRIINVSNILFIVAWAFRSRVAVSSRQVNVARNRLWISIAAVHVIYRRLFAF